jgi:hypothetical protein
MVQFYFLSIVTTILSGFVLSLELLERKMPRLSGVRGMFSGKVFRFVLGICTLLFGFLKLLSAYRGDVPVVGDLVPAAAGMIMGITLIIDYYKSKATVSSQAVETFDRVFVRRKSIIGIIGMAVGILHFFIPSVLFL